ncbi:MAG: hypothetical protein HXY20_00595 [Acidobacteria bacterium]|nr:hypothetical protein [Acidobacteriota bacterium]
MDCRTFHKNLEDYLQGGLDFPGRFGIERHAQQCLGCGKDLADALALARMARGMGRVAAPHDFESGVLRRIASRGLHRRPAVWWLQYHWPEWISCRSVAWAAPLAALVFAGLLLWSGFDHGPADSDMSARTSHSDGAGVAGIGDTTGADSSMGGALRPPADLPEPSPAVTPGLGLVVESDNSYWLAGTADTEYMEYTIPDVGGRPMVMRLPTTIRMRHVDTSEEYFIRNVSH